MRKACGGYKQHLSLFRINRDRWLQYRHQLHGFTMLPKRVRWARAWIRMRRW
jgi:hypothetical protein